MHLFDTDDSGVVAARPKFYIALVALSISTYITAGLAYWLVRSRKKDGSGRRNGLPKMDCKLLVLHLLTTSDDFPLKCERYRPRLDDPVVTDGRRLKEVLPTVT